MTYANRSELVGPKTKVKTAFVLACRKALSDYFWSNLDDCMKDFNANEQVLGDFPVIKMSLPFIRVKTSISKTNWLSIHSYGIDSIGNRNEAAEMDVVTTIDMYAASSKQRDRLQDAYLSLFIFARTRPENMAFLHELTAYDNMLIQPILNSISLGAENSIKDIPWCKDNVAYNSSISFNSKVTYAFTRGDREALIKAIRWTAKEDTTNSVRSGTIE